MSFLSRRRAPDPAGGVPRDDDRAFESVLAEFGALLRSLLRRSRPERYGIDLDDLEQEARIRLWKVLGRERKIDRPASYVYRVASSVMIDAVRRVRARREDAIDPSAEAVELPIVSPAASPELAVRRAELSAAVARAVGALDPNRSRAVRLHLQGFTTTEIAGLLDWTEPKARNLVSRGMADLRQALAAEGIAVDSAQ
jgi:RNA polymerase sigma-70 factor (ECF subfamily)